MEGVGIFIESVQEILKLAKNYKMAGSVVAWLEYTK